MNDISKRDWKLFREKLPKWQEAYMERLCKEYIELLNGDAPASEKFWALEKRIKEDRRKPGVIVSISRSELTYIILGLLRDGAITEKDLEDFSEEFQEQILYIYNL
ncbi:MAG: multidrug transporter [Firmicutes bacterium]|nr:multidrug transporter [Bacillota bacterium]